MTSTLVGKRILVVEDEYFIASDLKRQFVREGAEVIGPVGRLTDGLALSEEPLDAAVLDVNLEEAMSYPIADRLVHREIPYVFLTGYDGWSLPAAYQKAPRLAKPFAVEAVTRIVGRLIAGSAVPQ